MLHMCKLLALASCVEAMRPSAGKAPNHAATNHAATRRQSFAAAAATLLVPTAATAATAEQVERAAKQGILKCFEKRDDKLVNVCKLAEIEERKAHEGDAPRQVTAEVPVDMDALRVAREKAAEKRASIKLRETPEWLSGSKSGEAGVAARERREAARRDKKTAREARAAAARERREAEKAEASVRRRERIGRASAALDGERAERLERQERLVEALEDEAKHWLVDDATIDAKITPELFSGPPASTGLVTRESHAWWRYAAQVDGRPDLSTEDELLLNRDEEQTRVATTTERLIRTQAAHPREFHRVLDDGAAIAEAIADLDVQHLKPRVFRPRGPPPSKN